MCTERRNAAAVLLPLVAVLLAGCATSPDSPQIAYREAQEDRTLEVPPDLVRSQAATGLRIPGLEGDATIAAEFPDVRIVRSGDLEWIEIPGVEPARIWPRMGPFLRAQGLEIEREVREAGIVETGWAQRYDGPVRGGLTGFLNRLLFGQEGQIQDRYQLRLERIPDGGGTRVFLTHWDATEVRTGGQGQQSAEFAMQRGRSDPAVQAEMTRRLLLYLGMGEAQARAILADDAVRIAFRPVIEYHETGDGRGEGRVPDGDPVRIRAEMIHGFETIGAEVIDQDEDEQRYQVRWIPPGGEARSGFVGIGRRAADEHEIGVRVEEDGDVIVIRTVDGDPEVAGTLMKYIVASLGGDVDVEPLDPERRREQRAPAPTQQGPASHAGGMSGR